MSHYHNFDRLKKDCPPVKKIIIEKRYIPPNKSIKLRIKL